MSEQHGTEHGTEAGGRRARLRQRIGRRPWLRSAALVSSGLVAGAILAGAVTASAADGDGADTRTSSSREDGRGGPGAGEEALTGDTATQVEDAVLAEYPDAEIERLESDADGVHEAHIVTADGEELTVELDEEYAITGTEEARHGRGGHSGRGGPGGDGGPGAGEEALTGDTATRVEEAVLAEYPDAEVERLESDADGVYEAHVVTADGEELTVELDEEFAITGTESR